jgi:nucleoside-diphosphate-sugar epimerase
MEDLVVALQELGKKRILITGHTGFKGSWLTEWLLRYGAEITGVALEPEISPSHFEQLGLDRRIKHNVNDIRLSLSSSAARSSELQRPKRNI